MFYLVKTPNWVSKVYADRLWAIDTNEKEIFLTFDDGPHPEVTPVLLDMLISHNAKATFFCIGKNVAKYPAIYERILDEGHSVGNHSYDHLNGWKTKDAVYLENIFKAKQIIDSRLFRPPYGRMSGFQAKQLRQPYYDLKTVMWTVLSGDFDPSLSKEQCLQNVLLNTQKGSIVVFHDSEKAGEKVRYALPKMLVYFQERGYRFNPIQVNAIK